MLTLDLARLEREGTLEFGGEVPPDAPLWDGTDLVFDGSVSVSGKAQFAGSGEVLVDARIVGELKQECRRCLGEVRTPVDLARLLVFGQAEEEGGGEIRPMDVEARELELGEAVREELILAADPFVLCDPECAGLCPRCGIDLNRETCDCVLEEADPRWDALRSLKSE